MADGCNSLHVQYNGEMCEDAMQIALIAIAKAAPDIVSLKFTGPQVGKLMAMRKITNLLKLT